jgi:hypothetical protein
MVSYEIWDHVIFTPYQDFDLFLAGSKPRGDEGWGHVPTCEFTIFSYKSTFRDVEHFYFLQPKFI